MNHLDSLTADVQASLAFFDSELFKQVQMSGIFTDSKTFTDAVPKKAIDEILVQYQQVVLDKNFNLTAFVDANFIIPELNEILLDKPNSDIHQQIALLWQALQKPADQPINNSLLPLNSSYVVPGGRFREIYYWDSYFTALGLIESNQIALVESMLENFVDLQTRYGCIPNGNRSYYLSRSQPPVLGLMVELLLPFTSDQHQFLARYIKPIAAEYHFWMQGQELLSEQNTEQITEQSTEYKRVVKMPNGSVLNRYWDDNTTPRPESYREDIELLQQSANKNPAEFYRNIRAACESGWDFSSRWLGEDNLLSSIRTTRIIPIDLNCLLYKQEKLLSHYYELLGDAQASAHYLTQATARKHAINHYLWSHSSGFFFDYDLDTQAQTKVLSLAGMLPLFVELASSTQAEQVSNIIENKFLQNGGLITTCTQSAQQWDAPNGWAPLHWFCVQGLQHYRQELLAETIKQRWCDTVESYYQQTGKLMEKYNVCQQNDKASGGEYDVQEGFGWTNGVYQAFTA